MQTARVWTLGILAGVNTLGAFAGMTKAVNAEEPGANFLLAAILASEAVWLAFCASWLNSLPL
jgi:hypothetical protein